MKLDRVSVGLPGATEHAVIRDLAPRIEAAGFRGLWLNDTPDGDSLAGLAAAGSVTSTLQLGTGVIAIDRRPIVEVAARIADLPIDRLTIGIGSGGPADALARVRAAVEFVRSATTVAVYIGALGPRMRALAAEVADGILFNWLTPAAAHSAAAELHLVNSTARAVLYARTAVETDALSALAAEAAAYASYPSYAANFERLGFDAIDATIVGTEPDVLHERVHNYLKVVDELVLRAVVAPGSGFVRFVELAGG